MDFLLPVDAPHPTGVSPASPFTSPEPTAPDPQPASMAGPAGRLILWRRCHGPGGTHQVFGSGHPANIPQINGRAAGNHQLCGHYCLVTGAGDSVLRDGHR